MKQKLIDTNALYDKTPSYCEDCKYAYSSAKVFPCSDCRYSHISRFEWKDDKGD